MARFFSCSRAIPVRHIRRAAFCRWEATEKEEQFYYLQIFVPARKIQGKRIFVPARKINLFPFSDIFRDMAKDKFFSLFAFRWGAKARPVG